MPVYYNKPEVALKRAEELTTIKEYSKAIQILHDSVLSMHYYKDSSSTSSTSTGGGGKKNYSKQSTTTTTNSTSVESPSVRIIKRIHELSPIVKTKKYFKEALHAFKNQSLQSPAVLLPQLSFLILSCLELKADDDEDYRIVLDVLKNNSKLEELYAKVVTEKVLMKDSVNIKKIVELCHGHLLQSLKYNQIDNSELLIEVRLKLLRRCFTTTAAASTTPLKDCEGDMLKIYQDILLLDSEYEFSKEDGIILRQLFNNVKNYDLELKYSSSSIEGGGVEKEEEYLLASICSSSFVKGKKITTTSTASSAASAAVVKLYNLLNPMEFPFKFRLSQLKQVFSLISELDSSSSSVFKKYRRHLLFNVVLKKSIELIRKVYSEVSFDFLFQLFLLNGTSTAAATAATEGEKFFKFHQVELELLRQGAVISHAKRRVYFHGGVQDVVSLSIPTATSSSSSSSLKPLNNLSVLELKERYLKERSVYSKRKELIERRKEEMEMLVQEREERERRELMERIQREEQESRRILEEEAKRRELERLKREEEEIKLKEAEKLKKELNIQTAAESVELLDRDAILKAQYERLQQERAEQERRITQLKKRMDHQERAYRQEEQQEKLPQRQEQLKQELMKRYEEAYEMLKQASELKFKSDLELKQRFTKGSELQKDYEQYRQKMAEKYDSEYKELVREKQQKLQQEKQQRLEQLKKERREQLVKEKLAIKEKEQKEKEQREKEEVLRREKEERLKEMELIREEQRKKMEREEEAMRRRETFGGKTGGGASSGSKSYQPPHARKGGASSSGGNRFSALGGSGGQGGSQGGYDGGSDRRQTTSSSFFNRNK